MNGETIDAVQPVSPRLRLRLLGGCEFQFPDSPVRPETAKTSALLVYLAMHAGSHQRHKLMGLLWGSLPEPSARRNLRRAVWDLRRKLDRPDAPSFILATGQTVAFNRQSDYWLDVEVFEQQIADSRWQMADRASAISHLQSAISLYRGDFLDGFYVRGAPAFEEWMLTERERLRTLVLLALQQVVQRHTARGEYAAGIEYAARLLAMDPWREEAHRELMRLLALTGQRSAALAQYEECCRLLEAELGLEPLEETTALYEQIRSAPSLPPAPTLPSPAPTLPFVGRGEEHGQLVAWWGAARQGEGGLALVEGEAGVGKTRLVEEVARYAETEGAMVLRGRCYEFGGGVPYHPIVEALRSVLSKGAEEQRSRGAFVTPAPLLPCSLAPIWLAEVARLLPELRERVPDLPPPVEVSGEAARQRLFEAVARFLLALTGQTSGVSETSEVYSANPLFLFLDDLHWADPATLDLLHYVIRHLSPAPVWIIGTYRPEEVSLSHPLTRLRQGLSRDHLAGRLILNPLSEFAVQAIAREITATESEALGRYLHRESAGNPFIMVELIQTLKDLGTLEADRPHVWSDPRFANLLPAAVQDVILQRVGRLSSGARHLLTLAAVYGRDFDHNLLQALAGYDTERVDACLEEWLLRHLVQPRGRGGAEFDFSHDKIRAAVYEDVGPGRRRALHRQVGETLERLHPHLATAPAALLAHHWQAAGHQTKALPYLLRAGDQARLLYAHGQAVDYYRQALAILRDQDQDEQAAHTLMKLGLTHHSAFDFPQARAAYDQAFVLWQSVNARPSSVSLKPAPRPLRVRWLEPGTLDPALASDTHTNGLLAHLFSGLVELAPTMNVAPDVARAWEVCDAGRRFLFHLREDVYWNDGTPVTAQDFEYAWKRLLDPARPSRTAVFLFDLKGARAFHQGQSSANDVGVQAVDAHTLAVELERPTGYFLQLLTHVAWFPTPRHLVEAHGPAWADPAHFVSNGPFCLHAWQRGQSLVLRRNPRYHGRFGGNLQEVELLQIPDWTSRRQMYEAGELDVLGITFFPAAAFEDARLQHAEEYVSLPWLETHFLAFDVTRPPFDDVRVRRAFVLATDRNVLADEVLQGHVSPATGGLTPPGMSGHTPDVALPYNPDAARHLLAEAGYRAGHGFPPVELFAFEVVASRNRYLQRIWADILGVEVRLETVAWPEYAARLGKTPHHIVNLSWVADYPDSDNFLRLSRARAWPGWQDEAYERLVQMAGQSLQPEQRLRLYAQAEQRLVNEAPILPLLYERDHLLIKPWVARYPMSAIRSIFWKDVVLAGTPFTLT